MTLGPGSVNLTLGLESVVLRITEPLTVEVQDSTIVIHAMETETRLTVFCSLSKDQAKRLVEALRPIIR
jgi:hypothetical protein